MFFEAFNKLVTNLSVYSLYDLFIVFRVCSSHVCSHWVKEQVPMSFRFHRSITCEAVSGQVRQCQVRSCEGFYTYH